MMCRSSRAAAARAAGSGGTANGQCGQLEPHRPALGPIHQSVNGAGADLDLAHRRDQAGGFRGAEPQIGGSDLGQFAASPHPGERQRRVEPGGDHQSERRRQIAQQVLDRFVDADVGQQVVVVQDQRVPGVARGQVVEQRGQRDVEGIDAGHPQRRQRAAGQRPAPPVCNAVTTYVQNRCGSSSVSSRVTQATECTVTGSARPLGQQGGLAPPGRSDDEAQPPAGLVQHLEQAVPSDYARLEERRSELSGQQCLRRLRGRFHASP